MPTYSRSYPTPTARSATPTTKGTSAALFYVCVYAVMATAPPLPDGYDLCQALNANQKATGERIPFPELDDGSTP